jgi:signal transduction histidine kinase
MRLRPERRRFFIASFFAFLVLLTIIFAVLFFGAYALFSSLSFLFEPQNAARSPAFLLASCVTPVLFFGILMFFARLAFRRYGTPLAEVMTAVDAVAEGNFKVRVKEKVRGQLYGKLASRFNRMVEELDRAEQQRKNLTNDVAHELRNPLHIIQGNLEGILDGVYQPTNEHITATLDETRLLSRLVDDLQTISLAESGQLPLHRQKFLVEDLLSDVAVSFESQAAEAGVTLKVDLPEDGSRLELDADYDRMDQVLSNLVANALRYTPQDGCITLSAQAKADTACLMVADTGSGIAAEDLPFIFDRFWKGDRARSHLGSGGSGLGLAIARQLVQAHGGKISAESVPGSGSRFTVELPLSA